MPNEQLDQSVVNLAKAIRQIESNGNFAAKGASGEHGAYQYTPDTWASSSQKFLGRSVDLSSATREEQNEVAYKELKSLKDSGYNVGQIASIWNSGKPEWQGNVGTNKFGVKFDTPAYVDKVANAYQSLKAGGSIPADSYNNPSNVNANQTGLQKKEGLGQKLASRAQDIADVFQQPSIARGLLRTGGAIAGGVGDIIGAGISAITPDFIEKPATELIGGVVGGALDTSIGRGITGAYQKLDPEIRKDIAAVGNIASLVPVGKGLSLAKGALGEAIPTAVKAVAKSETGLIAKAAQKKLVKDALEVVAPKETAKVLKQAVKGGRTKESGLLSKVSMEHDPKTIRAAEAAAGVVNKNKTFAENANRVRSEIETTAKKLEKDLESMEITPLVQKEDMDALIGRAMQEIGENPTMVGDAAKSAQLILNKFKTFLPKGDVTAVDILRARKKLDKWMDSQTVSNVFNPTYDTAKTVALRHIRQGANDLVAEKAPDVAVKQMLARQSSLYDALDNLLPKAAQEIGTTGVERFIKRHPKTAGLLKYGAGAAAAGAGLNIADDLFGSK